MAETVTLQIPEALYQRLAIPYCITSLQQPQIQAKMQAQYPA
jgi:hypothetical protein